MTTGKNKEEEEMIHGERGTVLRKITGQDEYFECRGKEGKSKMFKEGQEKQIDERGGKGRFKKNSFVKEDKKNGWREKKEEKEGSEWKEEKRG